MLFLNFTYKTSQNSRTFLSLLLIIFVGSSISLFSQTKPSFNLSQGPTLLANGAADESVGAKYIYQNVAVSDDGLVVDAVLTIVAKVNVQEFNAGSFTVDTVIGRDDRFEPTINTGAGIGYVEWQMEFVLDNTVFNANDEGTRARLESFTVEAIDVDGFEFFDAVVTGSYSLEGDTSPPTQLAVSQVGDFTRFQSGSGFAAGIDVADTEYIVKINYTNVSVVRFRNGSSNDSNNRQNSVSFLGEVTFVSENTVVRNQPPVVVDNLGNTISSNSSFTANVLIGSSDPDNNLDVSKVKLIDPNNASNQGKVGVPLVIPNVGTYMVTNTGRITFIPVDEFVGNASVLFSVEDDLGVSSNQKTIEITVVDRCNAALSGNLDSDGDNVSDICDLDDDNDGILDSDELVCEDTSPINDEILVGSTGGRIYKTNTLTGGSTLLTTSPFTSGSINSLAANPENNLLYYGIDTKVYYYNLLTNSHALLADLSTFPEFSGGGLDAAGGSYLDGVYYVGSEDIGISGDLVDVFAVELATDGQSVLTVKAFNVYDAALLDGYDFKNDPVGSGGSNGFGDLVVAYEGPDIVVYGSTNHTHPTRPGAFWSFNTTTNDWKLISTTHTWQGGQTAADSNGNLYVSQGQNIVQIDKTNGNVIGSLVTVGIPVVDFTGPIFVKQCDPRQDTDGDGTPDYLDSDSDGDGCSDADEAYYGTVVNADADNNGFYGSGAPSVDAEGKVIGASYNTSNTFHINANINTCDDADMDGIPDFVDLDDDNDGILDADEYADCGTVTLNLSSGNPPTLVSGSGTPTAPVDGDVYLRENAITASNGDMFDILISIEGRANSNGGIFVLSNSRLISVSSEANQHFWVEYSITVIEKGSSTAANPMGNSATIYNLDYLNRDIESENGDNTTEVIGIKNVLGSVTNTPGANLEKGAFFGGNFPTAQYNYFRVAPNAPNDWTTNSVTNSANQDHWVTSTYTEFTKATFIWGYTGTQDDNRGSGLDAAFGTTAACTNNDFDNDGIPNQFDLDSDNDGCPDAIEAAGNFQSSNLVNPGTDDSLGDSVETNTSSPNYGVPIIAGNSTQQATTTAVLDDTNKDACLVDLSVLKIIDKPIKKVGDNIVFTITLKNEGDSDATNVMVKDILPTGLVYHAATTLAPTNTTYTAATGIWDLSLLTIKKGETKVLKIGATVSTVGTIITNKTEIFSATETDKDSTSNSNN